ncbi:Cu/Ag efflux protein CusF [Sinorhizobium terangae]|uniref:DUF1344 domain-containing protein n=1 Tax=Sinorhizobium terangae TaxID=110322 RepID=A0A6N7LPR6_SINTE|nr:DUF1344 domain-containing protein [Sinorhizobium terangae]MBB4187905.1 Cu/Ag efflux protein CusF [Sinorhizobium terangae]MQX18534.1 DUF1344 domain-containing protein [Sinorhizobium terangae]
MMIKRAIPAALLAAMLVAPAFAATMTGTIKTIDPAKNDIVLQSGETFTLPAKFDLKKLKVGEKVSVTYLKHGGSMIASKVVAAK